MAQQFKNGSVVVLAVSVSQLPQVLVLHYVQEMVIQQGVTRLCLEDVLLGHNELCNRDLFLVIGRPRGKNGLRTLGSGYYKRYTC